MSDTLEILRQQIENLELNLQLIQVRKTEYVQPSAIPLQLVRDERRIEAELAELHRKLMELERGSGHSASVSFIAGPPITHPRHFFGRTRELRRLFGLWRQAPLQNAAVIGQRRSGKTSLLNYLRTVTTTPPQELRPGQAQDWLPQPQNYRWIYVDFQDPRVGTCDGLLRHLLGGLNLPAPEPCDLNYFMEVVSQHLRNPTLVLLDEIGAALERYLELDDAFWEGLRALATNGVNGNLGFVLAAHQSPLDLAEHSGHGSPFFNIFGYTTTLKPLAEEEARELIGSSPIPFPEEDVAWILAQSGRWPLLLQILCRERLMALEDGEADAVWREEGLAQIGPFSALLH